MTKRVGPDEAKQRMREYLKDKGISHTEAEIACNFKRGYFSAGGIVGSDKLANFLAAYPDCDLYYIITGTHDGDPRLKALKTILDELETDSKKEQKRLRAAVGLVTSMVTNKL